MTLMRFVKLTLELQSPLHIGAVRAGMLARSHGIEYANNGSAQGMTSLFMRGANSNQTLVLIDGQRINNATNGLPALNALAPANIERVEIVRGAVSSLYGADALGGVALGVEVDKQDA